MFVSSFPAGPWQANCYVVARNPAQPALVIDPGVGAAAGCVSVIERNGLTPSGIVLTHGHIDHVADAAKLAERWDVPVWIHEADRELLSDPLAGFPAEDRALVAQAIGADRLDEPHDVRLLSDELDLAGVAFHVIHAPGHRPGCVMLSTPGEGGEAALVFTGDVIFAGSVGRTDLPGGDADAMRASLSGPVLGLPDDAQLLPGHGPVTTMGRERMSNPYLAEAFLAVGAR